MLSEHEQEALREIQRQLVVDDPDFERSFHALEEPTHPPPSDHQWFFSAGIIIATLLAIMMLLAGLPGGALAFAVIAGSVWGAERLERAARQRKAGG